MSRVSREINIVIEGEPVAQGRPRYTTKGGYARAYDPAKSRRWKQYVASIALQAMRGNPPMEGALSLSVVVYRSIPKSWSKVKKAKAVSGEIRPITRPDLDNYVKGLKDALSGIVYKDDAQIVDYHEPFGKFYSDKPRVEIEVKKV